VRRAIRRAPKRKDIIMHSLNTLALGAMIAGIVLVGCAGSSKSASEAAPAAASADLYTVTAADVEALKSTEPLSADRATLYVNGMSCPLCATNIDLQLKRVRGVDSANVDLSTGKVVIDMPGMTKPSPKRLADAAADAGVTLVRIEAK
jgi:copper chaperone CopZ